ncbi:MAG TPA: glycosyltransferase [Cryptosporangiaceae bacterium]|nr:glycosyltransferase [Cryptosporangiaceae bacterium]
MIDQVIGGVALVVVGFGLLYCFGAIAAGLMEFRHRGHRIGNQADHRYDPADAADTTATDVAYHVYAVVPALDEAPVIGATVSALLAQSPHLRIVVVDDGSTDDTAAISEAAGGERTVLVRRVPPDARQGKGAALNAGFDHVVADARRRGLDADRVLVCVMDADGRLSTGAVDRVVTLFEDDRVGGAQLAVRIRNRRSLLTTMQDFEFWGVSAVAQIGRIRTGTVSLGGNGQFARLSALLGLGRPPWSASLTEDLDLTISLLLEGWRLTSTVEASVEQQAVPTLARLLRQRTRWFHGHMACARRLPEIWGSRRMSHAAVLEMSLYLAVPWLLMLPWSVFFHLGLLEIVRNLLAGGGVFGGDGWASLARAFAWYVISFSPSVAFGLIYLRRNRDLGALRAIGLAHLLVVVTYIGYAAVWGAVRRMLRGESGWEKTRRVADEMVDPPAEAPAVVSVAT